MYLLCIIKSSISKYFQQILKVLKNAIIAVSKVTTCHFLLFKAVEKLQLTRINYCLIQIHKLFIQENIFFLYVSICFRNKNILYLGQELLFCFFTQFTFFTQLLNLFYFSVFICRNVSKIRYFTELAFMVCCYNIKFSLFISV